MSGVTTYVFTMHDAMASWKVSGSTSVVHATVCLSGRIIPVVFFLEGAKLFHWREVTQVLGYNTGN